MKDLVYSRERTLGTLTLVIGVLMWLGLIVGGFGGAVFALAAGFVLVQVALIAYVKGKGIELSEARFPDLHAQFIACCARLQIETPPKAYLLNGNGGLDAFATTVPGARLVVLRPGAVAAMGKHVDRVRFYLGHELGRLRTPHPGVALLRWPAVWLPLLGAAYLRARETTRDRHGLACSGSAEAAARALAALSAGSLRGKNLDGSTPGSQATHASRFWMSFHELTDDASRLSRRVARLMKTEASLPGRDRFAYLPAMFVPYVGRLGVRVGALVMVCAVALAAVMAVTAYLDQKVKVEVARAVAATAPARDALVGYYQTYKHVPRSLEAAGIPAKLADGTPLSLDSTGMALTVALKEGELVFTPGIDKKDRVTWECKNGNGLKPSQLAPVCSDMKIRVD
jgi:Zn-dependent protease with chaperone function